MTMRHTNEFQDASFPTGKVLAGISGMMIFATCAFVALWKAGICIPNLRFSAILFGAPCIGLYLALVTNFVRLQNKQKTTVKNHGDPSQAG
jgi:hypothetical protein